MRKYIILDKNGVSLSIPKEVAIQTILHVLKNGLYEREMFYLDGEVYHYTESKSNEDIICILQNMTRLYEMKQNTEKLIHEMEVLKAENARLKKDNLTNLYRPDFAMNFVRDYIAYAYESNTEFSLIMGDIDHFKNINDTYGHENGNKVLKTIGKVLLDSFRTQYGLSRTERREHSNTHHYHFLNNDILIRYGGEEILILLKNISLSNTLRRIEELRKKIDQLTVDDMHVSMSFGVYHFSGREDLPEIMAEQVEKELIEIADKMLYFSKENGRNRTTYYNNATGEATPVKQKQKGLY